MAAQILANTLIRFFVGLTVALGIASVLVVSVVQKSKEIGILRAMGTCRRAGAARVPDPGRAAWGSPARCPDRCWRGASCCCGAACASNPDGTPMFVVVIEPSLFALACAGATLVGMLAAVVPARRAARLDPVVAIRG